jgi:hypothetical protein
VFADYCERDIMPCQENGRTDSFLASVKADDFGGSAPYTAKGQYTPQNLQDLVAIVVEAESKKKTVKAVGSRYSFSHAYWSDDFIIDTSALNKHLSQPSNRSLPSERFRSPTHTNNWLSNTTDPGVLDAGVLLIHVEAGIKIKDLLADLKIAVPDGLALPTMGAGGGQSLAGALSTGTHGSDVRLQPLIDAVRAIHLVGPGGQEWWIERTDGFSIPEQLINLPEWCPDTRIVQNDYFFYAALVAVGRMGIIYSMVLEVRPEYWLEEHRGKKSWPTMRDQLRSSIGFGYDVEGGVFNEPSGGHPLHFFSVVLNPNDRNNCWVTKRWVTDDRTPVGADKGGFDPIVVFCKPAEFTPAVIALIVAAAALLALNPLFTVAAAILGGIVVGTSETFGQLVSKLLGIAPDSLVGEFNGWILDSEYDPELRRNASAILLDQAKYERNGCMEGDSAEYFFNANSDRFLQFVEEVFDHAEAAGAIPGYVSLRFTRQSDAFLAMERFPLSVAIEVTSLRPWEANAEYYRKVEASALANGGIPHWGQEQTISRTEVTAIYGEALNAFRWIVAEVEAFGRPGTFSSEFTRFKGLEPMLPLDEQRRHTMEGRLSVLDLFENAARDLALATRPNTVREVARFFHPSLRETATGETSEWGKARRMNGHFPYSLRLLRLRFR